MLYELFLSPFHREAFVTSLGNFYFNMALRKTSVRNLEVGESDNWESQKFVAVHQNHRRSNSAFVHWILLNGKKRYGNHEVSLLVHALAHTACVE